MGRKIPKHIPQYFDSPVTLERLEYKTFSGSYKATDYLRRLLEFTAIAVLGGDPFVDLAASDMAAQLRETYIKQRTLPVTSYDPIAMAMTWSWPPRQGKIIVFDCEELMAAVEALCALLCSIEPITIISRLSEKYIKEEFGEREFLELGEAMKCLGASRAVVKSFVDANFCAKNLEILRGYDDFDNT